MTIEKLINTDTSTWDEIRIFVGNIEDYSSAVLPMEGIIRDPEILNLTIEDSQYEIISSAIYNKYINLGSISNPKDLKVLLIMISPEQFKKATGIELDESDLKKRKESQRYIDGIWRKGISIGYCHYKLHPGNMTVKQFKQHECLGKQCPYFHKYEDAQYWKEREVIKNRKKEKKKYFTN